jgi:hypothetical protein
MSKLFFIIFVSLIACNQEKQNEYTHLIEAADSTSIGFKFEDRVSTVHKKDKWIFDAIGEVLGGKPENCSCQTTGFVEVYLKDSVVLDIDLATEAGGGGTDCQFIILNEGKESKCYKLNYRLGMYLDELRNFIKP